MSGQHPGRRGISFLVRDEFYREVQAEARELGMSVGTFAQMVLEMHITGPDEPDEEMERRCATYPVFTRRQAEGHDYPAEAQDAMS